MAPSISLSTNTRALAAWAASALGERPTVTTAVTRPSATTDTLSLARLHTYTRSPSSTTSSAANPGAGGASRR